MLFKNRQKDQFKDWSFFCAKQMKKIIVIFIVLSLGFLLACEKTTDKPTDDYLSGTYTEHIPDGTSYFEATLHSFSFKKDSFTAKIISISDVISIILIQHCDTCSLVIDSCASGFGQDKMYIKGSYSLANDSIYFTGKLCDSLYQHLQPTCSGVSDYNNAFKFAQNDTAIILNADRNSSFGLGIILRKE
jgi:hypothetical protein